MIAMWKLDYAITGKKNMFIIVYNWPCDRLSILKLNVFIFKCTGLVKWSNQTKP